MPNIKVVALLVLEKKVFKFSSMKYIFSPCDLDMQGNGTI